MKAYKLPRTTRPLAVADALYAMYNNYCLLNVGNSWIT